MKIKEIIEKADSLYPNNYTEEEKIKWCDELSAVLFAEYLKNDEGSYQPTEDAENDETPINAPYDEMYVDFVLSKCCYYQRDYDAYNRHLMLFNTKLLDFSNRYIEKNIPHRQSENKIGKWW